MSYYFEIDEDDYRCANCLIVPPIVCASERYGMFQRIFIQDNTYKVNWNEPAAASFVGIRFYVSDE